MTDLRHLRLSDTEQSVQYTYAGQAGTGEFQLPPRDRRAHAGALRGNIEQAQVDAREMREAQGLPEVGAGDVLAVRSEQNFDLNIDSLERIRSGIEVIGVTAEDGVTVATVFVPSGKHVQLLRLVDAYESGETVRGLPRNRKLIESISSIKLAAIRDFWQDSRSLFPGEAEVIWWEVWLRRSDDDASVTHQRFAEMARNSGMLVSEERVVFPERVVTHARGCRENLSSSIDLLSLIAELRRAKELATDYIDLPPAGQREFIDEALERIQPPPPGAPAVCILDSGVNREHPLLSIALSSDDTLSVNQDQWGVADDRYQHGTGMAGIALYGCLTGVLRSDQPFELRHRLESVKLLPPPPEVNAVKDYGAFTIQAVARAEIQAPGRNRAICMAVTADDRDLGMPSLWSAAVDQMCAGAMDDGQRLLFVSAGNLREEFDDATYVYHQSNCQIGGIEDPGQSWNAVTVGAYTEKVFIQDREFRGWRPLGEAGGLCPTSRTSLPWPRECQKAWPVKPDFVMEGGNYAERNGEKSNCPDLSLLTTTMPPNSGKLLEITHDTSPATASAARAAAAIWSHYPNFWPETVRGLLVHSSEWTDAMKRHFPPVSRAAVQECLRCYGYGVPSLSRALWSAENAATLLFEGELQPYTKVGSVVRTNEMHIHELPWPTSVLEDLGDLEVKMHVTLSYFIEPSPGRIGWTKKHRYQSHGLRFDVVRPGESEAAFRQRLSRSEWEDPDERPDNAEETRQWAVGDHGRRRGSVHSDWWSSTAAELASCNYIAVFPVTGWWRERQHLQRWGKGARYSLIVSIETEDENIDLYNPILTQIEIATPIEIE